MQDYKADESKMNWIWDRFLISIIVYSKLVELMVWSHYWLYPTTVIYPNYILPQQLQDSWLIYVLIGLGVLYFFENLVQLLLFNLTIVVSHLIGTAPLIMHEFKFKKCKHNFEKNLHPFVIVYQSFEIYHKLYMELISRPIVLPLQTVLTNFIIVCNFLLIRHWADLSLLPRAILISWVFVFQLVWMITLNVAGLFNKHSVGALRSWNKIKFTRDSDAQYFIKFKKSCKPLVVGREGYYNIKMASVFVFLRGIIRGTVRVLLAFKNS